ncbi:MAG: nucleotidyltransferase family protein [Candidatus Aenigmatarchaeota archaeon]|nr:MAG: nucleotidyltransferase family protein [Candidatus Aenigmarchaeota archaeon]
MQVVILAGGFAKRMWPLTLERPKPLLPVSGKPILEWILERFAEAGLEDILITTNSRFEQVFREWSEERALRLWIEPSQREEEKLGSIGAMERLSSQLKDDVLVVAGDNLFDFSLRPFLEFFKQKRKILVGFYDYPEESHLSQYGIGELDGQGRLVAFEEKPERPKSRLVSTGIYAFPKEKLGLFSAYIREGNNPDAFGYFIKWLLGKEEVYGWVFRGRWFDIGSLAVYEKLRDGWKG